tara:strand:- start:230 stop:1669 length:1440 start_codon:yes stop_codon:yes gene_type:complete
MSVSVNRVNYTFSMSVQLCFNVDSFNRNSDETPRFFLKPTKLLNVEKTAFTKEARLHGYHEHGNRFWKYKKAGEISDEKVEEVWEQIKTSYPYGYVEDDPPSILKYELDVKQDEAFQGHYQRYWENNKDLQIKPVEKGDGTYSAGHPYPYIEYIVNEIIVVKFPKGTVPAISETDSVWSEFPEDGSYYSEPTAYSCHEEDINVYVSASDGPVFYMDHFPHYPLTLHSSGSAYNFHLVSGWNPTRGEAHWPSGGSYANWSGYKFAVSTGNDWRSDSLTEYTTDVTRFASPEEHGPWELTVAAKDSTHSHYGGVPHDTNYGSPSGYAIEGESNQAPDLSLIRGHTYSFSQTGVSNSGHPLYISTGDVGTNADVFSSGVTLFHREIPLGEGRLVFQVPYEAPDTLYYQCKNHAYMGGKLLISDPSDVGIDGDRPGQTVRVKFSENHVFYGTDAVMSYYSPETGEMGGYLILKKQCDGKVVDF